MRADDYADLYAAEDDLWWFVGMRAITAALLDPLCPPGRDRTILDAGCGTGANLAWLIRFAGGGRVVGVDLASAALDFSRARRPGARPALAQASVTHLPFADRAFDLVTSFDVLGQIPAGGDARALGEIGRVLRPGGIAFIRVAAYRWMRSEHDEALGTHRRYTIGGLTGDVERAGLRVLRATYANSVLLPVVVLRRLVLKRAGLAARGSDVKRLPPRLEWVNRALTRVLGTEARVLRRPRGRFRAGLSVICVAERPLR